MLVVNITKWRFTLLMAVTPLLIRPAYKLIQWGRFLIDMHLQIV